MLINSFIVSINNASKALFSFAQTVAIYPLQERRKALSNPPALRDISDSDAEAEMNSEISLLRTRNTNAGLCCR
jgi:hypothetical protein